MKRRRTASKREKMAIYTKTGRRIINSSIEIDSDCVADRKLTRILALAQGARAKRIYDIADLRADGGEPEIWRVIAANAEQG